MSLSINKLTLSTPTRCLIEKLSFNVNAGDRWVIIGPNGAGKSSLLKACVGLTAHPEVTFEQKAINDYAPKNRAQRIGLLSQQSLTGFNTRTLDLVLSGIYALTTSYWEDQDHLQAAQALLESLGLSDNVNQLVSELSGGELRRAEIARLMLQNPKVMLLDEPLNHLDLHQQKATQDILLNHLSTHNNTALWVEHDLNRARAIATHALFLKGDGRWQAGKADDLLTAANLSELLNTPLQRIGEQGYLSASY
jgi:iron complex transport system ATP-binding protein